MDARTGDDIFARPLVSEDDAVTIARERYGVCATARELGSNQDRNFLLEQASGERFVLRIDNPLVTNDARDAQHAAIETLIQSGMRVPRVLPGVTGLLTESWSGCAVRLSEFLPGDTLVEAGYLAPVVLHEFGRLAAESVLALRGLQHPGLDRAHMWDMRRAAVELSTLTRVIDDAVLRARVEERVAEANDALAAIAVDLPVQPIHGDLTDDNVMGERGEDGRLHPNGVIDLGDLATSWRIAELAVTVTSMLHHGADQPLRVLETVRAYVERVKGTPCEATPHEVRALWPLVVLRSALLVASGWRQLAIDRGNAYAQERIRAERAMFDAATRLPLVELIEHVSDAVGMPTVFGGQSSEERRSDPLVPILGLVAPVSWLDFGVESPDLDGGRWLDDDAEETLIRKQLSGGGVALVPYGAYRLTRSRVNTTEAPHTYPVDTEIWVTEAIEGLVAPVAGTVVDVTDTGVAYAFEEGWVLEISGIACELHVGDVIPAGGRLGAIRDVPSSSLRVFSVGVKRADAPDIHRREPGRARHVTPERSQGISRMRPDPAPLLGVVSRRELDSSAAEFERRQRVLASAQESYYDRPMQIERGWRHYLVDTTGRTYIDMVNNVTALGHGHPDVADAVNRQIRLLGTNSRFLYRSLAEYSERLLELMPEQAGFDTVLLVNSGSEAVDLAIRLAQAATGRSTIVSLREAYHGWTMASDAVTTSAADNPNALATRPGWVHVADVPNSFRGTYRGEGAGSRYAEDVRADLDGLHAHGRPVAGFICETLLGNAGGLVLPEGYLGAVYGDVHAHGGLTIADEIQVGFGRLGSHFWGFEYAGVTPDIVTVAKPMGNGFPVGGVITSRRIADALDGEGQFFSSTGGNPVSCQAGIAVVNAMRDEGLQENAQRVGAYVRRGLLSLAQEHSMIGAVHGAGLYLGVELVRDRETLEPAAPEAAAICERLRELGVIVLTTSERSNVLKIKPPLCLTHESADAVLSALARVLTEGW